MAGKRAETRKIPGLGTRIREAREEWGGHGDSGIAAFAERLGIGEQTLRQYEADRTAMSAWVLLRIADVSHVSLDYLVRGAGGLAKSPTPMQAVEMLSRALHSLPQVRTLERESRRRYMDLVRFAVKQIMRLVYDAERLLAELHAHTTDLEFKEDEWRREHLDRGEHP